MHCPACQSPIRENDASCSQCGFTFSALDQLLGIPPMVATEVCDLARCLSRRQKKGVSLAMERFEMRFPQVRVLVVTCKPPEAVPLAAYTYWLFNRNQVVSAIEKGGANRLVMLAIDPEAGRAAGMIGYGLEPLVGASAVTDALNEASSLLAAGDWEAAADRFLESLAARFIAVCDAIPRTFGLEGELIESPDQLEDRPARPALSY